MQQFGSTEIRIRDGWTESATSTMLGGPIPYPNLSVLNALAIKIFPGRAKFQFTSIKPTFQSQWFRSVLDCWKPSWEFFAKLYVQLKLLSQQKLNKSSFAR